MTHSPFQTEEGREGLELALALATYEQTVALFFLNEGVLQLKNNHIASDLSPKNYTATFKALGLYDVEEVYVLEDSLVDYQLQSTDLIVDANVLAHDEFFQKLNTCQRQLKF